MGIVAADVVPYLLAERGRDPGLRCSNHGAWHSRPDLFTRDVPALRACAAVIVDRALASTHALAAKNGLPLPVYRCGIQGWAMIMERGHYVVVHDHAEAHWSAVYYLDAGDPLERDDTSGQLVFTDPRRSVPGLPGVDLFPGTVVIQPRTGTLILFPGWLQHFVHPYRGASPRICISCNVRLEVVRSGPA